jgi:predicted RNA-binding protein
VPYIKQIIAARSCRQR